MGSSQSSQFQSQSLEDANLWVQKPEETTKAKEDDEEVLTETVTLRKLEKMARKQQKKAIKAARSSKGQAAEQTPQSSQVPETPTTGAPTVTTESIATDSSMLDPELGSAYLSQPFPQQPMQHNPVSMIDYNTGGEGGALPPSSSTPDVDLQTSPQQSNVRSQPQRRGRKSKKTVESDGQQGDDSDYSIFHDNQQQQESQILPNPYNIPAPPQADMGSGRGRRSRATEPIMPMPDHEADAMPAAALMQLRQATNGADNQAAIDAATDAAAMPPPPPKGGKRKRKTDPLPETDNDVQKRPRLVSPVEGENDFPTSGPFERGEEMQIDKFVQAFREDNGMDQADLNFIIQDKDRAPGVVAKSFWLEAYKILPNRNAKAMQRHLRRRFHNYGKRGKWSEEDDASLTEAHQQAPGKWTWIGTRIGRMPEDCRDRWRNYLACGTNRNVSSWTEGEEMKLSLAVEECAQAVHDAAKKEAKDKKIAFKEDQDWTSLVNFNAVSEKMGYSRSRLQCLQHWKKIKAREGQPPTQQRGRPRKSVTDGHGNVSHESNTWRYDQAVRRYEKMLPGDKYEVLNAILDSDTYSEEKIPWTLITQRAGSLSKWNTADRKVAWERMKQLVPAQDTLKDLVGKIMEYFETNHGEELGQFFDGPLTSTRGRKRGRPRKSEATSQEQDEDGDGVQNEEGGDASMAEDSTMMDTSGLGSAEEAVAKAFNSSQADAESAPKAVPAPQAVMWHNPNSSSPQQQSSSPSSQVQATAAAAAALPVSPVPGTTQDASVLDPRLTGQGTGTPSQTPTQPPGTASSTTDVTSSSSAAFPPSSSTGSNLAGTAARARAVTAQMQQAASAARRAVGLGSGRNVPRAFATNEEEDGDEKFVDAPTTSQGNAGDEVGSSGGEEEVQGDENANE
ncbi:MAG: hypothetical protein M1831_005351 [Alyxoria varia]|nr:MAG: hypothetical protein M1831_005351 [Alyxoria varia]